MQKPSLLFDLDGTLINSTASIVRGFHAALERFGLPRAEPSEICSHIGHPLEVMFARLGAPEELISNLIAEYKKNYLATFLDDTVLLPGASEALALAASFADVGVVTTKTSRFSRVLLEKMDVAKYLGVIIGRDDVERPKPDAEPILKALAALGKDKVDAFMIGDTPMDALAAKNAGIISVGVSCGYVDAQTLRPHCSRICESALVAVEYVKSNLN